jgi:hypothetical protein
MTASPSTPTASRPSKHKSRRRPFLPWHDMLVWFLRLLSVFQLSKGIFHWAIMMGLFQGDQGAFITASNQYQMITVYFAVLDPVAGVGLWMTSSWGAVLWLLAAASQILVVAGFQGNYTHLWPLMAVEVAFVAAYLWLTWKVANTLE